MHHNVLVCLSDMISQLSCVSMNSAKMMVFVCWILGGNALIGWGQLLFNSRYTHLTSYAKWVALLDTRICIEEVVFWDSYFLLLTIKSFSWLDFLLRGCSP